MYKWYQALDDKKIISASSLKMLTTPYIKEYENGNSYYAYGWVTFQSDRGTKVITHNGFNGISYFDVVWLPEEDIVILFASNSFTSGVSDIAWEVEKMIFEDNSEEAIVSKRIILSGDNLIDAQPRMDTQSSQTVVTFSMDRLGTKKFAKATIEGVGKDLR